VEFLHTRIHADRLRQMRDARPMVAACPRCPGRWFMDQRAAAADTPQPLDWQDVLLDAATVLAAECPDHAHRFTV